MWNIILWRFMEIYHINAFIYSVLLNYIKVILNKIPFSLENKWSL